MNQLLRRVKRTYQAGANRVVCARLATKFLTGPSPDGALTDTASALAFPKDPVAENMFRRLAGVKNFDRHLPHGEPSGASE
eukprot:7475675-Pyramimonas_sp.AAC.1